MKYALFALSLIGILNAADTKPSTTITQSHGYTVIHADELKSWYDQGKDMVVVDARSKPYFDGNLLPKAHWLPYDSPESQLKAIIPTKDTLVVVYCSSTACPASKYLADRLIKSGYLKVYKYPEGLKDWMDKKYPIDRTN